MKIPRPPVRRGLAVVATLGYALLLGAAGAQSLAPLPDLTTLPTLPGLPSLDFQAITGILKNPAALLKPLKLNTEKLGQAVGAMQGAVSLIDSHDMSVQIIETPKRRAWSQDLCLHIRGWKNGWRKDPPQLEDIDKTWTESCEPYKDFEFSLPYLLPQSFSTPQDYSRRVSNEVIQDWQRFEDKTFWGLQAAINASNAPVVAPGSAPWEYYFHSCTFNALTDPLLDLTRMGMTLFDGGAVKTSELSDPGYQASQDAVRALYDAGVYEPPPNLSRHKFSDNISITYPRLLIPQLDSASQFCELGSQDYMFDALGTVFWPSWQYCFEGVCLSSPSYPNDVENYNPAIPEARLKAACQRLPNVYAAYLKDVAQTVLIRMPQAHYWNSLLEGGVAQPIWGTPAIGDATASVASAAAGNLGYAIPFTDKVLRTLEKAEPLPAPVQKLRTLMLSAVNLLGPTLELSGFPGLPVFEEVKRWFPPGLPQEQESLGFTTMYHIFPDFTPKLELRNLKYWGYSVSVKQYFVGLVLKTDISMAGIPKAVPSVAITAPGVCTVIPVNIGAVAYGMPRWMYDWVSVPEGGSIAHVWTKMPEKPEDYAKRKAQEQLNLQNATFGLIR